MAKRELRRFYRSPLISEMTAQQLSAWKNIAAQENRPIYLRNGLDIYPDGQFGINYKVASKYEIERAYEMLIVKLMSDNT
jgi:hypothetical protein